MCVYVYIHNTVKEQKFSSVFSLLGNKIIISFVHYLNPKAGVKGFQRYALLKFDIFTIPFGWVKGRI